MSGLIAMGQHSFVNIYNVFKFSYSVLPRQDVLTSENTHCHNSKSICQIAGSLYWLS